LLPQPYAGLLRCAGLLRFTNRVTAIGVTTLRQGELLERRIITPILLSLSLLLIALPSRAQDARAVVRLAPSASQLSLAAGEQVPFSVQAIDASGAIVDVPLRITGPRNAVSIEDGMVQGLQPGEYEIVVTVVVPADTDLEPLSLRVPVVVTWPRVSEVEIESGAILYEGTTVEHRAWVTHADNSLRPDPNIRWSSSDPSVATVDQFGNVSTQMLGTVTITASFEGVTDSITHEVIAFPGTGIELMGTPDAGVRTGDVPPAGTDLVTAGSCTAASFGGGAAGAAGCAAPAVFAAGAGQASIQGVRIGRCIAPAAAVEAGGAAAIAARTAGHGVAAGAARGGPRVCGAVRTAAEGVRIRGTIAPHLAAHTARVTLVLTSVALHSVAAAGAR